MDPFQRSQLPVLLQRLEECPKEPPRFMTVITGPRQTGKTTLVRQALERTDLPSTYVRGDEPIPANVSKDGSWLARVWQQARKEAEGSEIGHILALDEIQRIKEWSSTVKGLWDNDRWHKRNLRVVILGSSPLLMQEGLSESMAGRFEVIQLTHWSFTEMAEAFGFGLDQYIYFGGYPGAAPLIDQPERWRQYVRNAIIETNIERDIIERVKIGKPALMKQLFEIGAAFSGQVVSYNKILGQLQDAGNASTLARYLDLLGRVGLLAGLQKYAGNIIRVKRTSSKFQILNTALMTANSDYTFEEARADRSFWGRLTESAIGVHLCNSGLSDRGPYYWKSAEHEVDFVLQYGQNLLALEVKSGRPRGGISGLDLFRERFSSARAMTVGTGGIPIEEFLSVPVHYWFQGND